MCKIDEPTPIFNETSDSTLPIKQARLHPVKESFTCASCNGESAAPVLMAPDVCI